MALDKEILNKYKSDLIRKGKVTKTASIYSKWLRDICDYFDIIDPLTLDFDEVKEFIEHNIKKRPANTVNSVFHSLIFFYNKLNKKNFPFESITRPKRKRNTDADILTTEEIKKLFENSEKIKHKSVLMLMYSCGLDVSELTRVLLNDIDSTKGILHVRNSQGKIYRESPLPKIVIQQLREYWKTELPKKYLFENRTGEKLNSRTIQHFFDVALKSSGIKKKATSKSLKYSYVKHLEKQGIPLVIIVESLGMKTQSVYFYSTIDVDLTQKIKISPIEGLYVSNKVQTTKLYTDFWNLINPRIQKTSRRKFETGFYADAIESALKEINSTVKKIVKSKIGEELDGAKLMQRAFSVQNPVIE